MNHQNSEAYLKYFYLINIDHLMDHLVSHFTTNMPDSPDDLFNSIFSSIVNECAPYLDFINSPHSFNHTNIDETFSARSALLRLVLRNHCITHGFLTLLKESDDSSRITIRGANDIKLKTGYFKTNAFSTTPYLLPNGHEQNMDIAKNYNGYKKRFSQNMNCYSYKILNSLSKNTNNAFPNIPSYLGNGGCFIYSNPIVKTVNSNISSKSDALLKNYNSLLIECINWCKENKLVSEDKLLFEYIMESIYGFSFFGYAAKLLNKFHSTDADDSKITFKDFEGSIMLNLIQQTAQLPMIYNRSVFLDHCLYTVMNSKYLNSQEYQKKNTSPFSHTSRKPAPKELLLITGLDHIEKYLQKLQYIVLPLLENMWDTIIYKLNNEFPNFKGLSITPDTYCTYINKHYSIMAQDYSLFFDNEKILHDFYEDSLYHEDSSEASKLLYRDYNYCDILISKYERESFKDLLLNYFKPERPFRQHTDIYDLLMPTSQLTHKEISTHTEELNFYKHHSQNILSFAETITPFIS